MDDGPDATNLLWAFTLGDPPDDLIERLTGYTEDGNLDWVVVPVYNDALESFK
jgi:hypothetical protein